MGRNSGFIAMHAALASGQIDICLIPEVSDCNTNLTYMFILSYTDTINIWTLKVPFSLHGPHGVLRHLKYLIDTKGSVVVCVAEGAGQVQMQIFLSYLLLLLLSSNNHSFPDCPQHGI